jgi:hypothetical protein
LQSTKLFSPPLPLFLTASFTTIQLDSLEMMLLDLCSPLLSDVLVNPVSWCVDD